MPSRNEASSGLGDLRGAGASFWFLSRAMCGMILIWTTLGPLSGNSNGNGNGLWMGVAAQTLEPCVVPPYFLANGTWHCVMTNATYSQVCYHTCYPGFYTGGSFHQWTFCHDGNWTWTALASCPPIGEGCGSTVDGMSCDGCNQLHAHTMPDSNRCYCDDGYYDANATTDDAGQPVLDCQPCGNGGEVSYACDTPGRYKTGSVCTASTNVDTQTCSDCSFGETYTCPPYRNRNGTACTPSSVSDTQTCTERICPQEGCMYCPTAGCELGCIETGGPPYFQCACEAPKIVNPSDGRSCISVCSDAPPLASAPGYKAGNCSGGALLGAVCKLECDVTLATPSPAGGPPMLVQCQNSTMGGSFVWSTPPSTCKRRCDVATYVTTLNAQSVPAGGFAYASSQIAHGQMAVLNCLPNFVDFNAGASNFSIVCNDGTLSAPVGVCTSVCSVGGAAGVPGSAALFLTDGDCHAQFRSGESCTMGCAAGYVAVGGDFTLVCGWDHTWTPPPLPQLGVCAAACTTVPAALTVTATYPRLNLSACAARLPLAPFAVCPVECVPYEDGVPVVGRGNFGVACQPLGVWPTSPAALRAAGFTGECVRGACAPPAIPLNGAIGNCVTVMDSGANCSANCLSGFELARDAPAVIRCVNGVWSHPDTGLPTLQICVTAAGASSLPVAAIAGGVGGGALLLLAVCVCCFVRQRRHVTTDVLKRAHKAQETELFNKTNVVSTDVELDTTIGEGMSAIVYRAVWHGTEVAAKKLKNQDNTVANVKAFNDEVSINVKLPFHPRVINFVGACMETPNLMILMRFMDCGSLEELFVIKQAFPVHAGVPNSELHRNLKIALQVAVDASAGLLHCHLNDLIHRDVRAANFLITVDNGEHRATVSDFGISRFLAKGATEGMSDRQEKLPLMWMAPEAIMQGVYSRSTDVYMFAMAMFELFARHGPYPDTTVARFVQQSETELTTTRPITPPNTPAPVVALLKRVWNALPHERPSMQAINQELSRLLSELTQTDLTTVNIAQRFGIGHAPGTTTTKTTSQPPSSYVVNGVYDAYTRIAEMNHYAENAYIVVPPPATTR